MLAEGSRPPPAVCALRKAGMAQGWPSEVPPASETIPKGKSLLVLLEGVDDHASRQLSTICFMKQPYPVPSSACPHASGSPSTAGRHWNAF